MKKKCAVCQTASFKRSSDGGYVCKYGHKLLGIQKEEAEDEVFAGHGKRKKIKTLKERDQLTAQQHRSYEIQIIQFGLQTIARTLVQEFQFPPEFETTLREIWLLFISGSKIEIEEAYAFDAKESKESEKPKNSFSSENFEDLETFSDNDEEDEENEDEVEKEKREPRKQFLKQLNWYKLSYHNTLSFIYLTCIYLRYPIIPNDLIMWCESGRLPYLFIQNWIPDEILGAMNFRTLEAMNKVPTLRSMKKSSYYIARGLYCKCNFKIPDFNTPLLLNRFCSYYFLPVEGFFYASYLFDRLYQRKAIFSAKDRSLCHYKDFNKKPSIATIALGCVISVAKIFYAVDGSEADLENSSQFNNHLSKSEWLNKIRVNRKLWSSRLENTKRMEFEIELLEARSKASRVSTESRHKLGRLASVIEEDILEIGDSRPFMLGLFMEPPEVLTMIIDNKERRAIKKGKYYYIRRNNQFRPKHYSILLKLGLFIDGNISHIEEAMRLVDQSVELLFVNGRRSIYDIADYKKRYG